MHHKITYNKNSKVELSQYFHYDNSKNPTFKLTTLQKLFCTSLLSFLGKWRPLFIRVDGNLKQINLLVTCLHGLPKGIA